MATGRLNFHKLRPGFLRFGPESATRATVSATIPITAQAAIQVSYIGVTVSAVLPITARAVAHAHTRHVRIGAALAIAARAHIQKFIVPPRGLACRTATTYEPAATLRFGLETVFAKAEPLEAVQRMPWHSGTPIPSETAIPWQRSVKTPDGRRSPWGLGLKTPLPARSPYQHTPQHPVDVASRYSPGAPVFGELSYHGLFPVITPIDRMTWWNSGRIVRWSVVSSFDHGIEKDLLIRSPWDSAMQPPLGVHRVPITPQPPGKYVCRLNFSRLKPGRLNFRTCFGSGALLIDIRDTYFVNNLGSLTRVSDGANIACTSITVDTDWDSWGWRLSATIIGRDALDAVPTAPALVRATLNGFQWDFVPDDMSYERGFGRFTASLRGLSPAAVMISPYAAARSYSEPTAKTAAQLAIQELPFGWSLDWGLVDWTVPGHRFEYDNLTPLETIIRIVKSCGGSLFCDRQSKTLYARPRWPQRPWSWSFAADATLPSAYALKESGATNLGVEYEAILVSGGVGGMAAHITRSGTGGLLYAPTVTDRLVADITAAQGRAAQEVADKWPLKHYTLDLPLQAQPDGAGLIVPGTTLDFSDGADGWRGLVTGCSIQATFGKAMQTLELVSQ